MINYEKVQGIDKGDVKLFALSTCVWCKRTKQLLEKIGIAYEYIFVDHLSGNDKEEVLDEIRKHNSRCSFPTLLIDNEKCIVGFKKDQIMEELGDD